MLAVFSTRMRTKASADDDFEDMTCSLRSVEMGCRHTKLGWENECGLDLSNSHGHQRSRLTWEPAVITTVRFRANGPRLAIRPPDTRYPIDAGLVRCGHPVPEMGHPIRGEFSDVGHPSVMNGHPMCWLVDMWRPPSR